jgi:hypothetical protein
MRDKKKSIYWRAGGTAGFAAVAAAVVAATGGASPSHAAGVAKQATTTTKTSATAPEAAATAHSATDLGSSTAQLEQWAACERSHGEPNQADPTVLHQAIYIAVAPGALANWNPQTDNGPCSGDLSAAERAAAGGQPVSGWGNRALYVQYANCMRANGYPTFPYPSGIEPDGHLSSDFNGTGVDPNSPAFLAGRANQTCGQQIGAPAWWINNWGPPGSVDVYPAGGNPNEPLGGPGPRGPKVLALAAGEHAPPAMRPRATSRVPVPVPLGKERTWRGRLPMPVPARQAPAGASRIPLPVRAGA